MPPRRNGRRVLGLWAATMWATCGLLPAGARDICVGIDADAPTIAHGIKLAQPGDTIHLEPKVYDDYAGFYSKRGEPGRPITLDGHGATLEGSDPLNPAQWREISEGLFAADQLLTRFDEAMLGRWFFLFDGRMQLMGRTSKGKSAALKTPDQLAAGEWTFVGTEPPPATPANTLQGTFYIRLAPDQSLDSARIRVPVRSAGVQFGGDNAHLVIRNLTATHPYNDGFNIHGDCRDVMFENIRALECGDDGISAHESAQYQVDGFVSIGNSTGICDTGTAETSYRNVFIADCVGFDLYFLDEGRYSVIDAVIFSSSQNPLLITGRASGNCHTQLENVWFRRLNEPRTGLIASRAIVTGERCTFENLEIRVTGAATWSNTLINAKPSEPDSTGADRPALARLIPIEYQTGLSH